MGEVHREVEQRSLVLPFGKDFLDRQVPFAVEAHRGRAHHPFEFHVGSRRDHQFVKGGEQARVQVLPIHVDSALRAPVLLGQGRLALSRDKAPDALGDDVFDRGLEKLALGGKVMNHRPARDSRPFRNLDRARARVADGDEAVDGPFDRGAPRRLALRRLQSGRPVPGACDFPHDSGSSPRCRNPAVRKTDRADGNIPEHRTPTFFSGPVHFSA